MNAFCFLMLCVMCLDFTSTYCLTLRHLRTLPIHSKQGTILTLFFIGSVKNLHVIFCKELFHNLFYVFSNVPAIMHMCVLSWGCLNQICDLRPSFRSSESIPSEYVIAANKFKVFVIMIILDLWGQHNQFLLLIFAILVMNQKGL